MCFLKKVFCRTKYAYKKYKPRPRMLDTVKVSGKKRVRFIAHRGVSGIETENTEQAFLAAAERSYFGIETDLHRTADGNYILFHDDDTKRMTGEEYTVEQTDFSTLRAMPLFSTRFYKRVGKRQEDLHMPTLSAYIGICKQAKKTAVLELKNPLAREDVARICEEIAAEGYLDEVIFISFSFDNLVFVRELYPEQPVQYLVTDIDEALVEKLQKHRFDVDVAAVALTAKKVKMCHDAGILVNCWTVDEKKDAKKLIRCGVDFITSNILE